MLLTTPVMVHFYFSSLCARQVGDGSSGDGDGPIWCMIFKRPEWV